jgi:biotin carboxylase
MRPTFFIAEDDELSSFAAMVSRVADTRPVVGNDCVAAVAESAPHGVVTFDDRLVDAVEDVCHHLGLPGGSTVADPWDKLVQRERLNQAGASAVRFRGVSTRSDIDTARADIGRTGILKPRRSSTGRGVRIAADGDSTDGLWRDIAAHSAPADVRYLYEELMDDLGGDGWLGPFVSIDTASLGAERHHFGMFDKMPLARGYLETGHIGPTTISPDRARSIIAVVESALDALGVRDRITHTEVRLTSAGPQVIEVNGRLGGYVQGLCASLVGLDATRVALEMACGGEPAVPSLDDLRKADHTVVAVQLPLMTADTDAVRRLTRHMRSHPSVCAVETPQPVSAELRYAGAWVEAPSRGAALADIAAIVSSICDDPADRDLIVAQWRDAVMDPPARH